MADSFYTQLDEDLFESSPWTAGPWSPHAQHGGPAAALLTRQIEQHEPQPGHRLARVAVDVLAPVPVAPLQVSVEFIRRGKRIELLEATGHVDGRAVSIARAWRLTTTPANFPAIRPTGTSSAETVRPTPQAAPALPGWYTDGYISALEWCFEHGDFAEMGPGKAWARPIVDLVDDEPMSRWQRTFVVVDSGNGISLALPPSEYPAINCDTTLVLDRTPTSDWIGIDAETTMAPDGGAVTVTKVHDQTDVAGLAMQTLFARREA